MSNSINTRISHSKSKSKSFSDWVTNYDALVIFGGFGIVIIGTIILTGIFQAGDVVRTNLIYNAFGAFLMAFAFIYIIFNYMGTVMVILGKPVDIGMIIYVAIILFIMFVFGN